MKKLRRLFLVLFIFSAGFITSSIYFNNNNSELFDSNKDLNIIPESLGNVTPEVDSITKYSDISEILTKSKTEVPIYENLIPQGLAIVGNYYFISVYDNFGLLNSRVYVIDMAGNMINVAILDSNSHVGGIAYDKKNDLIWIPDNDGILNAYNRKDFMSKSHVFYKYQFDDISEELIDYSDKNSKTISYLTIEGNYLYIGSFALKQNGVVKKYKITKDIELEFVNMFEVGEKIQGITFYDKYMILSSSYGRTKTSHLYVYKYDEEEVDYNNKEIISYELPAMLEQVTTSKDELYLIFENTAKKYFDSIDKIGHICILDAKKTVNFKLEE